MQQLNGRVAVVTGGPSGIGRGLVNRFYVLTHPDVALADMRQRPQ